MWIAILWLGLAACARQELILPEPALDRQQLLSMERPALAIPPPSDSRDWLSLDQLMQDFLAEQPPAGDPGARISQLLAELLRGDRFHYDAAANFSASETFARRQGNCLSFSAMMVSLLRESGLRAHFQRVATARDWQLQGDTSVGSLHINTLVLLPGERLLEVDLGRSALRGQPAELIGDREALAEYHNNLGVQALMAGDGASAFAELRYALQLAPQVAHIWVNLAVWYRRHGDNEAAEAAWLQALRHNPQEFAALGGLQRLYRDQGRAELANSIGSRLEVLREQDPYYHYMLARNAFGRGDLELARQRLWRAMRLRQDPRFRELLRELQSAQAQELEPVPANQLAIVEGVR